MPVKRRTGKALAFDDFHRQQLLEGPDAVLLAGVGYLWSIQEPTFDRGSPEEQAFVLEEMRAGWARHGAELMAQWRSTEAGTAAPWALLEFGEPSAR